MKVALITGVSGQDGSYLAEFLLDKGYNVHGIRRYSSTNTIKNLNDILVNKKLSKNFFLHYADVTDTDSMFRVIKKIKPNEVYNLAAQSHVHASFQVPEYTAQVDAISQLRIIEVVKQINPKIKIYQAATSELYGNSEKRNQDELTSFVPVSPYSVAKLYGYHISRVYRDAYKMFICNGILFNHESPRRGPAFVSKKITNSVKKIANGEIKHITLGNLNSKRDWGYAKEYVESMWLMLQQKKPDDFVIATGEVHSVKDFVQEAFKYINIKIKWVGKGLKEVGIDFKSKKVLIKIDPYFMRPNELHYLKGNFSKSKKILGWKPKTTFKELVKIMMDNEFKN
ncbi:GDP-mannose 4,6-dehydratase [Pelagibacterales bacterium SAG-MED35]|nr:GDP-mannose 4,6-dehydratase [Pelagibacterales bacterium SAG-MED35]